jgi:photosystem II stability/assembly factor-like uncharacterized protein
MKIWTILILCFVSLSNGWAQYQHLPKNHQNDPDLPHWAKLMYEESPNAWQVKAEYELYYQSHPFQKTEHTQYYKRWMNAVKANVSAEGLIEPVKISSGPSAQTKTDIWSYCGPDIHFADNGQETEISEQANVYCHDRSLSDASLLFCGTECGGLYKSTNGGNSWSHVTKMLNVGAVSAVRIHPTDANTVFFSSANEIWRSTDGGGTWNVVGQPSFVSQNISVWEFEFNPVNPNEVYAATNQGLFKSIDGGDNWNELLPYECMTVKLKTDDPQVVFTVQFDPGSGISKFYKSTDGGGAFTALTSGWFEEQTGFTNVECLGGHMAVTEADPNRIYVLLTGYGTYQTGVELNGWIGTYVSYDAGETWINNHNAIGTPYTSDAHPNLMNFSADDGTYTQIHYNTTIVASQIDPDKVLIGGLNLWISNDAATTYQGVAGYIGGLPYFHVDQQEIRIYKTSPTTEEIWISNDGGINYSDNFMGTFQAMNRGIHAVNLWGYDQGWNEDIMVGGRYHNGNMGYHENYGPGNFLSLGGGEAPTGYVNYSDENKTYFSDIQGKILPESTTQQAQNFSISISPNESYWNNESSRIMFDHHYFDVAWLGKDNVLYRSSNGGSSFNEHAAFGTNTTDKLLWLEQCYGNQQVYYVQQRVGVQCKLWRSLDGAVTWNEVSLPLSQNNMIFTVGQDENEIWVVYPNAGVSQRVYFSNDGGQNWLNTTGALLGSDKPWAVVHALGTNQGVYLSTQTGRVLYKNANLTDWVEYSTGLPVNADPLRLVPFYRDQKIRLATWNHGVWEAPLYESTTVIPDFAASHRFITCPGDSVHFVDHSIVPAGATYSWAFEGGVPATSTMQFPTVTYPSLGSFSVTLTIHYNGQNYAKTKTVYIVEQNAVLSVVEDFESGAIPDSWSFAHPTGGASNWNIAENVSDQGVGTYCMKFDNYWIDVAGDRDEVRLPKYYVQPNSTLKFSYAYAQYDNNYSDTLAVQVSTDCGASWVTYWVKGGADLNTANPTTDAFVPTATQWGQVVLNIGEDDMLTNQTILVAFQNRGRYGNQLYVDNINLQDITHTQELTSSHMAIWPNPTLSKVMVSVEKLTPNAKYMVYDANGKLVQVVVEKNANSTVLNLDKCAPGSYWIVIVDQNQTYSGKVVKMENAK